MDVLVVVDMQEVILKGAAKHDLLGVIERINHLAEKVRREGGCVVYIRHAGEPNAEFDLTSAPRV